MLAPLALPLAPLAARAQAAGLGVDEGTLFQASERGERRGHIVSLDPDARSITVRAATGEETRFSIEPGASILGDDRRLDFDALQIGQEVRVRAELHQGEAYEADFVTILDPRTVEHTFEHEGVPLEVADTATIIAVDRQGGTFTTRTEQAAAPLRFRVGDDTSILSGHETIALSDLEVGQRVVVMTLPGADDDLPEAARVQIVSESALPRGGAAP